MQEPADPSPGTAEAQPSALGAAAHHSAAEPADAASQPVPGDPPGRPDGLGTPAVAAATDAPDAPDGTAASDEPQERSAAADTDAQAPAAAPGTDQAGAGAEGPTGRQEMSPAACGARLAERFPGLFGTPGPVKPIKLRIHVDLQQRAPGEFPRRALSAFLSRHTTSNAYLKALLQSPHRYDLDGQPAGDIDAVHREAAQQELERRRASRRGAPTGRPQRPGHPGPRGPGGSLTPPAAASAAPADTPTSDETPRPTGEHDPRARPRSPRGDARPGGGRPREARPDDRARGSGAPRRPPTPGRAHPGAAAGAAARPPRPPQTGFPENHLHPAAPGPGGPSAPLDPAQRARLALVRAWESSPLTQANFCVLMRVTPGELEAAIEQVRRDRPRPDRAR